MAYKKFTKETKEFQMFQEFWTIFQNFGEVENTEKYWEELQNTASQFSKKYGTYGTQLMISMYEEFERRNKGKI